MQANASGFRSYFTDVMHIAILTQKFQIVLKNSEALALEFPHN